MYIQPKFWYIKETYEEIWRDSNVFFSFAFCRFFANNVERIMLLECNLKASNKVSLSLFKQNNDKPTYEPGEVSKLNIGLSILPYMSHDLEFCWKTKDGSIVTTTDEDFDEENLICWINGLKPKIYWEQAYGKKTAHPFVIKNLPYELDVLDYGTDMSIRIDLSEISNSKEIVNSIIDLIEQHNTKSLSSNRDLGIVHNSSYEIEENFINYRIDLGSAGLNFIKKVLRKLSKYPSITKVILDL
jgi:hypothetical protein